MSQSGYIAALLLAAFILFLAAQNRLVTYASVLWGKTTEPKPQGSASSSGGSSTVSDIASAAKTAATVAAVVG